MASQIKAMCLGLMVVAAAACSKSTPATDDADASASAEPQSESPSQQDTAASPAGDDDDDDDEKTTTPASSKPAASPSPSQTTPSTTPSSLPRFPGAGESDAAEPLTNSEVCDAVSGAAPQVDAKIAECYVDKTDKTSVAATLEQVLECADGSNTIHLRLTLHPWFVDNTYGTGSIGWPRVRGHWFRDLLMSDHAEIIMKDSAGEIALRFKLDYLSEDKTRDSGYGSLGVNGGDGEMLIGDPAAIVRWSSSLDRNLNERGYGTYTVDSPATDASFTTNPTTPDWDYRVVFEAWIDVSAFGSAGFGGATIEYVHASPAKSESETIEVEEGECPPCMVNSPDDSCGDTPPPPPDKECEVNSPDDSCGDGTPPPPPDKGGDPEDPDSPE